MRVMVGIGVLLTCGSQWAMADEPKTGSAVDEAVNSEAPAADESEAEDDEEWDISTPFGATHTVELDLDEGTWMSVSVHGDTILFDLLGDIWSLPLGGGDAIRLTEGPAWDSEPRFSPDGSQVAFVSDGDGNEQIWLMNADGTEAEVFSDEVEARLTDPVWDPDGDWLIVRRRTVDTRSIGVTELHQLHLSGGTGFALTSKDWHPHAGETVTDGRYLYFSSRNGRFNYDENPVGGLWKIVRLDRTDGELRTLVHGAGSAARPVLSPDGKSLYFVSRDRVKTLLEVQDLATGERRTVADWLDHDQMEGFALHGVYPAMDWADEEGEQLVLWAQGKLWRLNVRTGVRVEVPFRAQGEWVLHDVIRAERPIPDTVQARVIRWPELHPDGRLAFSAMGSLWVRHPDGELEQISEGTGFSPAWSPDGKSLAWTRVREGEPGELLITRGRKTEVLPIRGQLLNPAWSPDGEQIVVFRGGGGSVSEDLNAEPWFEIVLLTRQGRGWDSEVLGTAGSAGPRASRLFIHEDRIWFTRMRWTEARAPGQTTLVSMSMDGHDERVHLVVSGAEEVVPSPDFTRVAYKLDHQVHVAAMPTWGGGEVDVTGGAVPSRELTEVVGDWLSWAPDGQTLLWMEGSDLKSLKIETLEAPDEPDESDKSDESDEGSSDAVSPERPEPESTPIGLELPRDRPEGVLALTHATVLTMEGDEVLEDATLVIDRDRIQSIESGGPVPEGARILDCTGKTIIPGLIDVHGHMHFSAGDVLPEDYWRYEVSLDFGVTTVSDPSASTDLVFTQAERIEAGLMRGPRIYSTGRVLYGALSNTGADTPDEDAARRHVQRIKMMGGNSVKVYQQSRRDERQWYVQACIEEEILCVAEGGGDLWMNLGMTVDGYQAIEHSLPNAPVYGDVQQLMSASATDSSHGVAYTPTLLVAYGGLSGENWFYQHMSPVDHERLLKHAPVRQLDRKIWRRNLLAHPGDWNHHQAAADAASMARDGLLVTLGGHGQLQGLGPHWELWALAGVGAELPAMSPMEALHAATLSGARYLGMSSELGSIKEGKLADLIVLSADPRDDIRHTTDIHLVIKNGQIWDE